MICPGKGVIVDLFQRNPVVIHRAVQGNNTGNIVTNIHIHDDLEVGVGMFDLCQVLMYRNLQTGFLLDFTNTGRRRCFPFFNFTPWEFP